MTNTRTKELNVLICIISYSTVCRTPEHPTAISNDLVRRCTWFPQKEYLREDYDHNKSGATVSHLLYHVHGSPELFYWETDEEAVYEVLNSRFELFVLSL